MINTIPTALSSSGTTTEILITETEYSNTIVIEGGLLEYFRKDCTRNEHIAVNIFALVVIATLCILIIKCIKKLTKKYNPVIADTEILVGQISRLVLGIVVALMLTEIVSIPNACIILGIMASLCAVGCMSAGVLVVMTLVDESGLKAVDYAKYLASAVCNLFMMGFVLYFQLFMFWEL